MKSVKQTDILTGSIPKQLLLFFLPIWFGTLFQQLYNTADTLIVGNFVGTNALAAVGATGPFVNLLVGLFVGLCSGAGVVIAQSWGAHDPDAVDRQVHTALVLSAAVGALLTVLGLVTAAPMMRLLGTPDEILPDAALYLRIYFLGMIPQMLYNMGTNILRAIGDSKRPLYFLIAASLVNIVLDVVFIAVFGWGVMGAALATVIAEYATLLIGLLMVRKILKLRGISGEMLKTAWRGNFRRLLALNRDIMLRSLLLQLCFGAITVLGARLGSDIVAVNAVLMTLLTFTAYALDGFAYAVEARSGQAYGARDGSQLLDVWRAACRQSGIVALLFSVVYLLAGEHIIALLTSLTQIQQLADRYLIWQVILPLVGVWCYLLDGMFIGATRAAEMRNSMAVAAAGFALTLLTLPWLGNHGLWLALTVFLALRGLSLAAIWRRHWRNGTWFAAT